MRSSGTAVAMLEDSDLTTSLGTMDGDPWTLVRIDPGLPIDPSRIGTIDVMLVSPRDLRSHGEFIEKDLRRAYPETPMIEVRRRDDESPFSPVAHASMFSESIDRFPALLAGFSRRPDRDRLPMQAWTRAIEFDPPSGEGETEQSKLVRRPLTKEEKREGDGSRLILDTLGEDVLTGIVLDSLNLLGTSGAVYEKDGKCSIGVFSSGWCKFLDDSFRNEDEDSTMEVGETLCHHRCWSSATKQVIEATGAIDKPCPGGLRIFAVPIKARGEVIGSINIGYGDPPLDPKALHGISKRYGLDEETLAKAARSYRSRPPFIVEAAKARLRTSAQLIGVIMEKVWAERENEERTNELLRSNEDLETFAYVASHDLQEPLRMMTGYLGLIEKRHSDQLDEEGKEFLGYAIGGAGRMSDLVNELLDYSRAGSKQLKPEECDMEQVLTTVRKNLERTIRSESGVVVSEGLPTIRADRHQMEQLLQNLVGNGLKFHGERHPTIRISAMRRGSGWTFSVQDNGIGMEKEERDRLFQMFARFRPKEYDGTGIGLAICKKIVERHGGRIWAESTPGVGSTFSFTIPDG